MWGGEYVHLELRKDVWAGDINWDMFVYRKMFL
jgi:hypothetical protein